jgi:threonine/homoserine/homoserine lactone efflux protein
MPWWGLVLVGVGFVVTGILALLAYSYWGWERRIEAMAVINPLAGVFFVAWGIGRGARRAARHIRSTRGAPARG